MVFYKDAAYEIVQPLTQSSLNCRWVTAESFSAIWHFHPELEIMSVERSHGLRFIGDSVERFGAGDLVLIGPNLPHVWINRGLPRRPRHDYAAAVLIQFAENFLGRTLWRAPEFAAVAGLLARSRHGVHFHGPEARRAARRLKGLTKLTGVERLAELLAILHRLARSPNQRMLSRTGYVPQLARSDAHRIARVRRYVHAHLTGRISRRTAATLTKLEPARFSAFFRERMGCTFTEYVNELRIAEAMRLMAEGKRSVSDACYASGFKSLPNFNFRFRALKGMSPQEYRRQLHEGDEQYRSWLLREAWIFPRSQSGRDRRRKRPRHE